MRQVTGQVSIDDLLHDLRWEQAALDKHYCAHCDLTYWASPGNPKWTLALQDEEHREVEPGVCARMAEVRDTHEHFQTGRRVMEPHWSKQQYRIYAFQAQDVYEHVWRAYHSRQESEA